MTKKQKPGLLEETAPKPQKDIQNGLRADGFRHKRSLTLDVVSITKLGHIIAKCEGELVTSEMPSKFARSGKADAVSIDVTDMVRGGSFTLVLNTVAASALRRAGEPLMGRYFEIAVGDVVEGKRYRSVEVNELEEGE